MKAIIMAGGKGTRMRPLTCELPKPMIPVMNKPVLEYILLLLKQYDIRDIALTLMYLPQKIMDYFGDGSELGLSLKYFVEESLLGTAGSIKAAASFLDDTFVVISGDCITNIDLNAAIQYHRQKNAAVTIVLKRVDYPLDYGIAITNSAGYITEFFEKPSWGEVFSDTANTGIYIMEPWVLDFVDPQKPFDFSRDVFPKMLRDGHLISGYVTHEYWNDIGGLDSYIRTHHDFFDGHFKHDYAGLRNDQRVWIGENTFIDPTAIIRSPCFIGSNCRIGPNVLIDSFTVIGDNCIIENDASIRRCIVWNNCFIDYASELRGCVLGNHVQIMQHVAAFENAIIGDETLIRERSIIKANIKIWPRKYVEPQSVVDRSIIWATRLSRVLFGQRGLSGVLNIDMTPEFASRLGAAYGSVIGKGFSVTVSSDPSFSSQLFKLAFLSGLISVGVDAYEMENMIVPIARRAVAALSASGGIHIMQSMDSTERLQLLFYDSSGIDIDKTLEKSIEAAYFKEEFRRCNTREIGRVVKVDDFSEAYIESLIRNLDSSSILQSKPKICIASSRKPVCAIMERILHEIGCLVVSEIIMESFSPYLLMQEIDNYNATLGAYIDGNGDRLILMDQTGRIIRDDQLFMLTAYILFNKEPGFHLLAPNNMTSSLELLALSNGGTVNWTKTGTGIQMKTLIETDISIEKSLQYQLQYDALSCMAYTIEYLSSFSTSLEAIMNAIPSYRVENTSIHCPWESMGKVMRLLIKENDQKNMNLTDGIKIKENGTWVLILPDAEQPMLHIYAEGKNMRDTKHLLLLYTSRIESFIEDGSQ